ncbi:serine beta-lactamase-like protein LACTB, mitochondrial isoform X2 [Vanacampus margaritifer]
MYHLLVPHRLYAKFTLLPTRMSTLWISRAAGRARLYSKRNHVFNQSRCYVSGSATNLSKNYQKFSLVWVCGAGMGLALVFGLKYAGVDNGSCDNSATEPQNHRYDAAIQASRVLVERIQIEAGAPGLVVGVSVDGVPVWCEGVGYADLENRLPCGPETVMRLASISKSLTSAAAARLCEEGKLNLDAPVQKYVPEFPQKQFDGQNVTITPRMILSHLSGIRHYEKDANKMREDKEKAKRLLKPSVTEKKEDKRLCENKGEPTEKQNIQSKEASRDKKKKEFEHEEYYLTENFESVTQALDLFKDDPLIFKPGTTFLYSTHAYTLLSAVIEQAAGQRFLDVMNNLFRELGMLNTVPDQNEPIIYHRARYYRLNKRGRVVNCPYVDNSYKWAGGGFLSTVGDLLRFGNVLLYSYQMAHVKDSEGLLPAFLKPQTAVELWTAVDKTEASWDKDGRYGQGWLVVEKEQKYGQCRKRRHYVSHTGGAVGASSVLLVLPSEEIEQRRGQSQKVLPQGVVVSIITNMQSVGLNSTALKIAHEFDKAKSA